MTDFEALEQIADVNEFEVTDSEFDMGMWLNRCGTVGCLFGNWLNRKGDTRFSLIHNIDGETHGLKFINLNTLAKYLQIASPLGVYYGIANELGISDKESQFLFAPYKVLEILKRQHNYDSNDRLTRVRRIRKFIAYKLRKFELLSDYEAARRMGDVNVAKHVMETVGV
jgi:hypothetical protein